LRDFEEAEAIFIIGQNPGNQSSANADVTGRG
jgi:hypothetical protein